MPRRPYLNYSGVQLKELFKSNSNDIKLLKQLLEELEYRTTPKMKLLANEVTERISHIDQDKILQESLDEPNPLAGLIDDSLYPPSKAPPLVHKKPKTHWEILPTYLDKSIASSKLSIGSIRPQGKIKGVPSPRIFKKKDDVKLEFPQDSSLAQQYEICLKALIDEMRRAKTGIRQIIVENGEKIPLDGMDQGYVFIFDEDVSLFEGASVLARVGAYQTNGYIVGKEGKNLIVSLQEDFGPRIAVCTLRIDNTAMLEALRLRLEKIIKGESPHFNAVLAEAVIGNSGEEQSTNTALGDAFAGSDLNQKQKEAILKILNNEVLYLWGPPGTGKTQTLSSACLKLIESNKRLLVCSNTNQAVDQVLLKICVTFGEDHPMIKEGKIIRIGKIAHDKLEKNWEESITVDGIVKRKSYDLINKKSELEEKIEKIDKSLQKYRQSMALFKKIDAISAEKGQNAKSYAQARSNYVSLRGRRELISNYLEKLKLEKERIISSNAVSRVFLRSEEAIDKDLMETSGNFQSVIGQMEETERKCGELLSRQHEIDTLLVAAMEEVMDIDRKMLEKKVEDLELQKTPMIDELSEIKNALENIRKTILDDARIIGTTITKLFLSPQDFTDFDVVIIDEASMVLLPALFNAAGYAREKVVISGDFLQLSPIVQTEQQEIYEVLGRDVFNSTKIDTKKDEYQKRVVMLREQYRMHEDICKLVSLKVYDKLLVTSPDKKPSYGATPPSPFDGSLTLIDTSPIYPFVNKDNVSSRYNLMHALVIRNLCRFLLSKNYYINTDKGENECRIGICTPYSAQAKVLKNVISVIDQPRIGTVHTFQGDEKEMMIFDIPDSYGEPRAGVFFDCEQVKEDGAKLLNVAFTRAKDHLVIAANLAYLDKKLPPQSILRYYLSEICRSGKVVDVRLVLALYPITDELRRLGFPFELSQETEETGLFNQKDFCQACAADMEAAKTSISIFSGFVTTQRVATLESLFRRKVAEGVAIRCVTRPPKNNGSIPVEDGKAALDGLEQMGCIVDTRGNIHEKVVIIDEKIVWFGSLNPLSHTSRTDEVMARIEGDKLALQVAVFMALNKGIKPDVASGISIQAENPRCPKCGTRAGYFKGRNGPFWACENCDWTESVDKPKKKIRPAEKYKGELPTCECGHPMILRQGRFGQFFGCSDYPKCKKMRKITKSKKNEVNKVNRDSHEWH